MKIRYKLQQWGITFMIPFTLTLIVVIGGTFFLLYWNEAVKLKRALMAEAQRTAHSVAAVQAILSGDLVRLSGEAQDPLFFRQLNPGTATQQYIECLNQSGKVVVKQTSDQPRNPENAPDEWERQALTAFKANPSLDCYCAKIDGSEQVYRYAIPQVMEESCLQCHGGPQGEIDLIGYAKEGLHEGDLRGIISVTLPLTNTGWGRTPHVLFFILLSAAIIIFTWIMGQRMVKRLKDLANTDTLTQVANRNMFYTCLEEEIKWALKRRTPLAVIMIDVDYFKKINDRFGHIAGDEVLKQFAKLLQGSLRKGDLLARIGGEEFVIIAPNTDVQGGYQLAERLRQQVENHRFMYETKVAAENRYELCQIPLTVSAGVAALDHSCNAEEANRLLIRQADAALYRAKYNGRNRVEVYGCDHPK